MTWLYNSFHPLVFTRAGCEAAERHGLPRFIDGSCRREPDLESAFPSITALCRGGNFAPRLRVGDTVIYVTVVGWWKRRLVAVLRIRERFDSHEEAAAWYRELGLPLPSNCMVKGNDPIPYDQTVQDQPDLVRWDLGYRARTRAHPMFLATDAVYCNVLDPPIVSNDVLMEAFGRRPGTRNPGRVPEEQALRFLDLLGVEP